MRTIDIIKYQAQGAVKPPAGTPSAAVDPSHELRQHLELCEQVLRMVERENQALRGPGAVDLKPTTALKKNLLPRLTQSLNRLRELRVLWQQLNPAERAKHPEVGAQLRQNQDLTMKIIMLDRENEQLLLRRGLLPANQLPPVQRQQAHFVSELYRRQGNRIL